MDRHWVGDHIRAQIEQLVVISISNVLKLRLGVHIGILDAERMVKLLVVNELFTRSLREATCQCVVSGRKFHHIFSVIIFHCLKFPQCIVFYIIHTLNVVSRFIVTGREINLGVGDCDQALIVKVFAFN